MSVCFSKQNRESVSTMNEYSRNINELMLCRANKRARNEFNVFAATTMIAAHIRVFVDLARYY